MDHQKVFSTHIFVKDNFLAPQRVNVMQEEMRILYEKRKHNNNWQTGPDLDKSQPFSWFAQDIGKSAFDIFDKLNYIMNWNFDKGGVPSTYIKKKK